MIDQQHELSNKDIEAMQDKIVEYHSFNGRMRRRVQGFKRRSRGKFAVYGCGCGLMFGAWIGIIAIVVGLS